MFLINICNQAAWNQTVREIKIWARAYSSLPSDSEIRWQRILTHKDDIHGLKCTSESREKPRKCTREWYCEKQYGRCDFYTKRTTKDSNNTSKEVT